MRAVGPEVLGEAVCSLLSCLGRFSRCVGDGSDVRSRVVIAVGDGKREPQSDDVFGFQSELGPADDASPQDSLLTVLLHATMDNTFDLMARF